MIAATDIITLAPGVDIRQELLRDVVRGDAWPLNASGAFVLARAGRPVVRLVPIRPERRRRLGRWKGRVSMAKDFDAPLPRTP